MEPLIHPTHRPCRKYYVWQMAAIDDRRRLRLQGESSAGTNMSPSELNDHWIYQCDDIAVDPRAHRLERDGQVLPVEPKAFAVLVTLLEQAGNLVDKDTLLDAAWGHRHVTPGVLSHTISQLRHALGDSAFHPRYIATVHTIGYRFMGEVHLRLRPAFVLTEPASAGAFKAASASGQLPSGNPTIDGAVRAWRPGARKTG
jgi:DNA-binding winged helix-turn-helix (wHTH) protein